MMQLEQVQAEVEAFADRYVLQVSQATDQAGRRNPEFRARLHAVKLAVAQGAYTVASGPNPVVSLLDMIVQATLVRSSIERNLARSLPDGSGDQLLSVAAKLHDEAWALGERILSPDDLADLRVLVDSWIEQNPSQVYVAGIRLSDFARLRPTEEGSRAGSILGWLKLDPFASIDPAAREIQESRLFAERAFYYLQRMPQLLAWQSESLYLDLARAHEVRQFLASFQEMADASKQMSDTIDQLPAHLQESLSQGEQSVRAIVDEMNASMETANDALARVDETAGNLRGVASEVADAGHAWKDTVNALNELMATMAADHDETPREPVTVQDVTTALQEARSTAVELRQLLDDFNAVARAGSFEGSVAASTAELRRAAQSIIITSTMCAVAVIAAIVAGAITYRTWTRRPSDADNSLEE